VEPVRARQREEDRLRQGGVFDFKSAILHTPKKKRSTRKRKEKASPMNSPNLLEGGKAGAILRVEKKKRDEMISFSPVRKKKRTSNMKKKKGA